jgi:hypothetical protein
VCKSCAIVHQRAGFGGVVVLANEVAPASTPAPTASNLQSREQAAAFTGTAADAEPIRHR